MPLRIQTYYQAEDLPELPEDSLFHAKALFRLYAQTPGYSPRMLVAYEDDRYVGKLLYILRQGRGFFDFFTKCTVYGVGEYQVEKNEATLIFKEMLTYLTHSLEESVWVFEFRNLTDALFGYQWFIENRYFPVKWLRVRNALDESDYTRWMSRSRHRQIQRALREGVRMEVVDNDADEAATYRLLRAFYASKWHRHLPKEAFFIELLRTLRREKTGKIIRVMHGDKMIGAAVCLYARDTSYLYFSGGLRKTYARLSPGVMAVWFAMEDARAEGKRYLEFMHVGVPYRRYGYRDFILRFGGYTIGTRRWYRLKGKWLNRILGALYR